MIYYLGYYNCEQIAEEKRIAAPPAMNKMGYIISALTEAAAQKTIVVSPCETGLFQYVKGSYHSLTDRVDLKTFDSVHSKTKLIRILGHALTKLQAFFYLLCHIQSTDTLIVYHSLSLMRFVKAIKKIKHCKLIIEVEEIYSDVREDEVLRKKEVDYLQISDKYIVITEMLNKDVNLQNKPRLISHGTYKTLPCYGDKFDDGKIHVVYAGSFNPVKGGVYSAIATAEFLDEQYVLHILGKGTPAETEAVIERVKQTALKSKCRIVYDGYKTGKEFDAFIQACHIGLSTQQPDGKYNASSFPSKILMYMSNGLPVVSVRIPAVETSDVGEYIYYYDIPNPQEIAKAVQAVPMNSHLGVREKLNELDEVFKSELSKLLM